MKLHGDCTWHRYRNEWTFGVVIQSRSIMAHHASIHYQINNEHNTAENGMDYVHYSDKSWGRMCIHVNMVNKQQ